MPGGCPSVGLLGVPTRCMPALYVGLSACLPTLVPQPSSPRALEGAVSLSGRARLSSSYAPAQLREPGWRPGGRGGVGSKRLP